MNKIAFTLTSQELNDLIRITAPTVPLEFGGIITAVLPFVFGAAGIALIIYIILGGYQIMLSGGNPKNIEAGKSKITNAVVGFIILSASYLIFRAIATILGLSTITNII